MNIQIRHAVAAGALLLAAGTLLAKDSSTEIASKSRASLDELYAESSSARELATHAEGILVFPSVVKVGIAVGGSYGEGTLFTKGKVAGTFNIVGGSIGLQLGAQKQSVVMMFMTKDALRNFQNREGWKVGVDGSVAILDAGGGKSVDTQTIQDPIVGFIFSNKGLMAGITLEGSKISRINR